MFRKLSALFILVVAAFMAISSANVSATTISRTIVAGSDDAEEPLDSADNVIGDTNITSTDLELSSDGPPNDRQWVGMRFTNITIPQGTLVTNATIQFTVDTSDTEPDTDVRIFGEKSPNAATFEATPFNITNRPRTTASVLWNDIPVWTVIGAAGPDQQTPNLAPIIQEIVNQPGWASGNALSLLIAPDPITDGADERTAGSFESDVAGSGPPILTLVFGSLADIDGNGSVDAADYTILRNNMASHLDVPVAAGTNGDLNFDQKIDIADFRIFKNEASGIPALAAALASVPEPSAAGLAILAMCGLAYGRRRTTS